MLNALLVRMVQWFTVGILPEEPSSPYQEAIALLKGAPKLDSGIFRSLKYLVVVEPTVETYLATISKAIVSLERGGVFRKAEEGQVPVTTIQLCDFYLSSKGEYLDPSAEQHCFIDAACTLLDLYERKSNEAVISAVLRTNLTRIRPVIDNLFNMAVVLNEL